MKRDFSELTTKARNGDADAFAELYSLIYKDLYRIALCNLKNPDDASDVVSDTVLDAFTSITKLKDINAFKAWMIRILTFKIKRKQAEYIKNRDNTTEISEETEQKMIYYDNNFNGVEIIEQLSSLKDTEKLVFSLSVICGYTSEEISNITGIKPATVRSHLLRGREKLKTQIENL